MPCANTSANQENREIARVCSGWGYRKCTFVRALHLWTVSHKAKREERRLPSILANVALRAVLVFIDFASFDSATLLGFSDHQSWVC
jgi:hypothetical protein